MKDFIKQRLREDLGSYSEVIGSATNDEYQISEYWDQEETPLSKDLDKIATLKLSQDGLMSLLRKVEDKYRKQYQDFEGDTYGVISAMEEVLPSNLKGIFNDIYSKIREENAVASPGVETDIEFRFNDGVLNKNGHNTIYADDEAIVDFGIGQIGTVSINGNEIPNTIYLQGGYNAAVQGSGYGSMGLYAIFTKLPKINNLILQCYDTACPFWTKMGGEEITNKEISPGNMLRTLVLTRDTFFKLNSI